MPIRLSSKKLLLFLGLFILPSTLYLWGTGFFSMHDDLQVMRMYQMEKCFADGQLPCRWVSDMAYGYGQAMFNYYSAFPYYLGLLIRITTPLSILGVVKLLFIISLVSSSVGMYLFSKEFWGEKGAFLAAILYTYAPYHALDIYVRGALSEAFALAILPFLWLYLYKTITSSNKFIYAVASTLAIAALLTTHNISTLMYAPFTAVWVLYWLSRNRTREALLNLVLSGIVGIGLSAFFFFPVLIERSLIQSEFLTSEYLYYGVHFVSLKQLFVSRIWGYGSSEFGPNDDLSFQIGWPHWWIAIVSGGLSIYMFYKRNMKRASLIILVLILSGVASFMTHQRSIFIWQSMEVISFVQFPWRFLGLVIFLVSFAGGAVVLVSKKNALLIALLLSALTVGLNYQYFKPRVRDYNDRDSIKLSGESLLVQKKSAIVDYLPKTSEEVPESEAPGSPTLIVGDAVISDYSVQSNRFSFTADVSKESIVQVPVMYFPGWKAFVENREIVSRPGGRLGLVEVVLKPGRHVVEGKFTNTPIRSIGNATTTASLLTLLGTVVYISRNNKLLWLEK